ncbi:sugar phosphate isomerase/epimerase, partial [Motilibacter sp. E257]
MGKSSIGRRGFLGLAGGTALGVASTAAIGPLAGSANAAMGVAAPDTPSPKLGLQLYSVRDKVSGNGTAIGFAAVFEELARIGFKELEFAGYTQGAVGPITPAQIKSLMDANGLNGIGSHISWNALTNPAQNDAQFAIAKELALPYIGTANDFPGT